MILSPNTYSKLAWNAPNAPDILQWILQRYDQYRNSDPWYWMLIAMSPQVVGSKETGQHTEVHLRHLKDFLSKKTPLQLYSCVCTGGSSHGFNLALVFREKTELQVHPSNPAHLRLHKHTSATFFRILVSTRSVELSVASIYREINTISPRLFE